MDAIRDGDMMGGRGLLDFLEIEMVWRSEEEEEEEINGGVGARQKVSWMWRISGFNGSR